MRAKGGRANSRAAGTINAMHRWTRLMVAAITLACSSAPTLRADLLQSLTFNLQGGGNSLQGQPPVLFTVFATISPQNLPGPGCVSSYPLLANRAFL